MVALPIDVGDRAQSVIWLYIMSSEIGRAGRRGEGHSARPYRLRARARSQEATRRRIAAAAAELHQEVGPARTTIVAIARRAGVGRPTVYSNFPDERRLMEACQGHFLDQHPPPDLAGALAEGAPAERLRRSLRELYGWYAATEPMTANVERDRRLVPALDELLAETADARIEALAGVLAEALGGGPGVTALVRLALDFSTWRRLAGEGLSLDDAAAVMARAVGSAAAARG
jgi:AcrR family transcriptional regulator